MSLAAFPSRVRPLVAQPCDYRCCGCGGCRGCAVHADSVIALSVLGHASGDHGAGEHVKRAHDPQVLTAGLDNRIRCWDVYDMSELYRYDCLTSGTGHGREAVVAFRPSPPGASRPPPPRVPRLNAAV